MNDLSRVTGETLELMKGSLAKTITIGSGLTAYDLQAPAKNLYPTITPLRNALPRVGRATPGDAARWRSILGVTGSGFDSMGWVPEGQRSASMNYSATPKTAPYYTIGEEDSLTFEAEAGAVGFEDVNSTMSLRLLQKTMRKEEISLLGGNNSLALGTPTAPTLSAAGSGATLSSATYSVIVVAMTQEGYMNSSTVNGLATTKTITGNDGGTYTLNGGVSNKSSNTTQAVTLGQTLSATTPAVVGAVAYAWFVGTAGSEKLQSITTINSATFSAPLSSSTQAATAITADYSQNATLAYDGFLTIGFNPANSAVTNTLATGTAGTGTFMTSSGRGSVVEIDNLLVQMWNTYRLSPTVIYVNAQEQRNITNKCLTGASGPLLNYRVDAGQDPSKPYGITANGVVRYYFNPYSVDAGQEIPIKVHPDLAPGTILMICERLPVWYQSNEVQNTFEVMTQRDYYRVDWPVTSRRRFYGVYSQQVLAPYVPFGVGILSNIGNG